MIDEATVRNVATLARLSLSDEEVTRLARELGSIAGYVAHLSEVENIALATSTGACAKVWREDEVGTSTGQELFLSNAPAHEAGYLKVPPIIE